MSRIARKDVRAVSPETSLDDLARTMFDRNVERVVFVDAGEPVGILTDRDLAVELLAEGGDVDLVDTAGSIDGVTAAGVMTTDPLRVNEDD